VGRLLVLWLDKSPELLLTAVSGLTATRSRRVYHRLPHILHCCERPNSPERKPQVWVFDAELIILGLVARLRPLDSRKCVACNLNFSRLFSASCTSGTTLCLGKLPSKSCHQMFRLVTSKSASRMGLPFRKLCGFEMHARWLWRDYFILNHNSQFRPPDSGARP